ncbi:hypothetical protein FQR65_LT09966 [Abscondita terminalis]|nr:hypothetical protein FQR65_LT09966 [Abscondita terminalis]
MALNIVIISVLAIFAIGVLSDDEYDILNRFKTKIDECITETKVDRGIVESLFEDSVFTEDKALKCFIHCFHVKLNFVNENGVVNVDEMKNVILPLAKDKVQATGIIEKCSKINEGDKCETAFAMEKCFSEE